MNNNFKNLNILLDEQHCNDLMDKNFKSLVVPYALTLKPYQNQKLKVCIDNECIEKDIYDNMVVSATINKLDNNTSKNNKNNKNNKNKKTKKKQKPIQKQLHKGEQKLNKKSKKKNY